MVIKSVLLYNNTVTITDPRMVELRAPGIGCRYISSLIQGASSVLNESPIVASRTELKSSTKLLV